MLEGAFALLAAVAEAEQAGLTRLARDSGLPKTTAHRLLEQLVELGAVERAGVRSHYRMGPRLLHLGQGWEPYPGLKAAAAGPIRSLTATTGATTGMGILREGASLAVAGIGGKVAPLAVRPGSTYPWYTAAGKVLVAHARPDLPLGPLPPSWRQTAAAIREDGLAVDREELIPGVFCAAVPVLTPRGTAVAAVAVLTDSSRELARLSPLVRRVGRIISANLRAS